MSHHPTTRAALAPLALLLAATVAACGGTAPPPAPPAPSGSVQTAPADARGALVERLLDFSKVDNVVGARAPEMTRRVAYLAEDLTDQELERLVPAVQDAFAPDRLRADVASFLRSEADEGRIEGILAWMEDGANAELTRLTDGYEPSTSLDEFVRGLQDDPPTQQRILVVARWAEVLGAGDFYVLMDQALSEAAHTILAELRPSLPRFEPLSGQPLFDQLEQSFNASVVTFLHAYEPVPDEVLRRATEEYESEDGQWFVETYSLAVARALRAGAERAAAALR